jgi:hypothetical protein
VVFLSSSRQMPGECFEVYHDHFIPHPFQFTLHRSSDHSTLHFMRCWQCREVTHKKYVSHIV